MARLDGQFITVEGGEGVGKSTQCAFIIDLLRSHQIEAILSREPGGSEGADQIRQLLVTGPEDRWDALSETLLLYAARRDHVVRTLRPSLEAGIWVVSDRFNDSSIAYQGYGHGIDLDFLNSLNQIVTSGVSPNLTFMLDAPSKIGLERAVSRGGTENRFEQLYQEFHEKARQGFLTIARDDPKRCQIIDATQDQRTVESEISKILESFLSERSKGRYGQSIQRERQCV